MKSEITNIDVAVIIAYLVGIVFVGIWVVRKEKMSSQNYFLAGRSLNWLTVGAALFASNISTIHLTGLAADGFSKGLVVGNFEWMASFTLIVLGLVFAPFYFKSKIETLPEFIEKRYGADSRAFLAFIGIIGALFAHIGISLYAGAVVFENFFAIDKYVAIIIISVLTSIYTVLGGLKSVVITETIQTVILLVGAILMTLFAILALPNVGINSVDELIAACQPNQFSMIRTEGAFKWYEILLGYPVLGIWYWCADQTIVQRVLGAKTLRDAQTGPIFAGFIKILPVFFMVLPGVLAYVLFKDLIKQPDDALPILITQLLPTGLKGLMAAALLAALMSTVSSALNSSATLVAVDIVEKMKPTTTDKQKVLIGRITSIVVMILAILWSPLVAKFESIFSAINTILAVLSPPVTTIFLWGVFSKRGTKQAAFYTMVIGFALGALVFLFDFPAIGDTKVITDTWEIPFMMQAFYLFVICSIFYFAVSAFTPKPASEQIATCTFDNPLDVLTKTEEKGIKDPRLAALLLVVVMAVLYFIFR